VLAVPAGRRQGCCACCLHSILAENGRRGRQDAGRLAWARAGVARRRRGIHVAAAVRVSFSGRIQAGEFRTGAALLGGDAAPLGNGNAPGAAGRPSWRASIRAMCKRGTAWLPGIPSLALAYVTFPLSTAPFYRRRGAAWRGAVRAGGPQLRRGQAGTAAALTRLITLPLL